MSALFVSLLSIVLAGVATHTFFKCHEPKNPIIPVIAVILEPLLIFHVVTRVLSTSLPATLPIFYTSFLSALAASIIGYRLSPFHPLAQYPGPTLHKISKLRTVYLIWTGRQHFVQKELHDKYGPIVRVGPNELSIVGADAVTEVLGANGLPKGQYYDARQDPTAPHNLIVLRGEEHANRRRLWNRGMSTESLVDYETLIATRAQQLVERLRGIHGTVDISRWISYFSFDFMGDMAFGGGFNMLRDGEDTIGLWKALENFMFVAAVVSQIPWASRLLQKVPFLARDLQTLRKHGVALATNRVRSGPTYKDLWYHLTDEAGLEKAQPPFANVVADGTVAIVAGADTVATAVICLLYLLLSNPPTYQKLQAEVDSVFPPGENALDTRKHASMPFLTACISETLRILPPVPTNGSRRVPPGSGGKLVAGHLIPENTEVYVPAYSLHRDPRYFSPCPDKFWPERWLNKDHTKFNPNAFNPNAFIPFSHGPANCVGRNLAKREMMMLVSLLLQTFEVRFADGFDPSSWESRLHDHLVLTRTPLPVVLTPRHDET